MWWRLYGKGKFGVTVPDTLPKYSLLLDLHFFTLLFPHYLLPIT